MRKQSKASKKGKRKTHALLACRRACGHGHHLRLFLRSFHRLQITVASCHGGCKPERPLSKANLSVLVTCLRGHFLPVQPEDDDDVEGGLYDDANQESQPKTCREGVAVQFSSKRWVKNQNLISYSSLPMTLSFATNIRVRLMVSPMP